MTQRGDIPPAARKQLHRAMAAEDSARIGLQAAVIAAHEAGGSVRAIAAETGKSATTIHKWLKHPQ